MNQTENYNLNKPEYTDNVDVAKLNENADIIDAILKEHSDALELAALGFKYRGAVDYYADLPLNAEIGDAYTVKYSGSSGATPDGTEYVWGNVGDSEQWIDFSKDAYTKAETDALLSGKQDTLTQAQLAAVNSGIDSAKVEQIETNKNNISTDEAALVELVDSGAKNLLKITATSGTVSGVTYTVNDDKTISFNGTADETISLDLTVPSTVAGKTYFISGCPAGGATSNTYRQLIRDITNQQNLGSDIGNGVAITFQNPIENVVVRINIFSGYTANNLTFKPMLCSKAAWDISQTYQPHRPSYQELYERVVALEQANQ